MPGLENRVKEEKVRDLKSDLVYRYRGGLYINLKKLAPDDATAKKIMQDTLLVDSSKDANDGMIAELIRAVIGCT